MQHVCSTASTLGLACVLAFAAAPALAGDIAQLVQTGTANTASIEQIGSNGNNAVTLRQGDDWQNAQVNTAAVVQQYVDNASVEIFQAGFNNQYTVFQHEGGDLRATINSSSDGYASGDSNVVSIDQSGYGMRASVEQGGALVGRAEIVQSGWGGENSASISQVGFLNQAAIFQSGSGLSATIVQNTSASPSFGFGNSATIRQGY